MPFNLDTVRAAFPSLALLDDGKRRIYFDNPAGTQVPSRVLDRMRDSMLHANANLGGAFSTSAAAERIVQNARQAMQDFLNAESTDEIVFGQNMTSLTLQLSRSIGRELAAGDEIVVSRMDHDANVEPWLLMARDHGLIVRWLPFNTQTFEFDEDALDKVLSARTRLVCVTGASNLTGTLNDLESLCGKARKHGAWTYIDAVQSAPHVVTDVQALGCDFLTCSAYKFFGPHQGILYGRRAVLERLTPYKVRPAPDTLPWCFETGTQSQESMAGTAAAVDYFAWVGRDMAGESGSRREQLTAGMRLLLDYEKTLSARLIEGMSRIEGLTILGISDLDALDRRVPTVAFRHARKAPRDIASALAADNIFVWSGHNYALEAARALGILETGGAVRVGPVHYNSVAEIDEFLFALEQILSA
ncbi:MAG: cysteine desulfurase-like protein [Pseudomonadota bacterium]